MFREFKVGDLFDGSTGDTDLKKEHLDGQGYPVVTAGVDNLGIAGYSSTNAKVLPANTLTVDMFGNCYFRPFEYKMVTHARVFSLSLKDGQLTPETGLYICTMFNWLRSKYNYSNMCSYNKIKAESIQLPVKPGTDEVDYTEDDIDWRYMESYIHELDAYLKETGLDDYMLTDDERKVLEREPVFKEFEVGELFDCSTTKSYNPNKGDLPNGNTPYVTRSAFNNGISGYFDDESGVFMNDGNCITIGAEGGVAFYQPDDFIAGIKVYTLRHDRMNCEIGMFLCGALNVHSYIYSYTNARVLDKIKAETVQLPVKPGTYAVTYMQDDIDWTYMEAYVRIMEKQVIADVVDYKNEVISKTKELVKN